jgi:hypothetical protein
MEAMQLKASGVVAGEPDLIFAWNGRVYGIEMKIPGGRASKDQESVHSAWMENGNPIFTCWSFEEFQKVFESIYYGNQ